MAQEGLLAALPAEPFQRKRSLRGLHNPPKMLTPDIKQACASPYRKTSTYGRNMWLIRGNDRCPVANSVYTFQVFVVSSERSLKNVVSTTPRIDGSCAWHVRNEWLATWPRPIFSKGPPTPPCLRQTSELFGTTVLPSSKLAKGCDKVEYHRHCTQRAKTNFGERLWQALWYRVLLAEAH